MGERCELMPQNGGCTMGKSEIRKSVIDRMKEKVRRENYRKYLRKVRLVACRAFKNELVQFDFPVTALIGPNGGGKTTILGACALLYESVEPRRFFARNQQLDKGMKNWSISYEAIDRDQNKDESIKRSARFSSEKWSRKSLKRNVVILGVERTLPAVERSNLSRFTNKNVSFKPEEITELNDSAEYI